jgi:hypothetical protein
MKTAKPMGKISTPKKANVGGKKLTQSKYNSSSNANKGTKAGPTKGC